MADLSFTPGELNITASQGDRVGFRLTAGTAFPYSFTDSGTFLRSTWRKTDAAGTAVLALATVTSGDGIYIRSGTVADFEVSAVTTAAIGTPGVDFEGYHDIEVVPGGTAANAIKIAKGAIVLYGEATR